MALRSKGFPVRAMNLYLDDNSCKGLLATLLRSAGHSVIIPADVGHVGAADARHFIHAAQNSRVLLTRDYEDFLYLHDLVRTTRGQHSGVLAVRSDMTQAGI